MIGPKREIQLCKVQGGAGEGGADGSVVYITNPRQRYCPVLVVVEVIDVVMFAVVLL